MTKKDQEEMIQLYKDQLEFFKTRYEEVKAENVKLQEQNFILQEGLLNIRAPEAYHDMQRDRIPFDPGASPEDRERRKVYREEVERHLQNIERPIFETPDDMEHFMNQVLGQEGPAVASESLHGNSES